MHLNTTKYANIRERKLCIGDKTFEMAQKFKYLDAVIDDKNNITHTIKERIQSGNKAYCAKLQLVKSKDINRNKKKLRGFSPQVNYTDRATAACRRS
jgi:hypothetical protein